MNKKFAEASNVTLQKINAWERNFIQRIYSLYLIMAKASKTKNRLHFDPHEIERTLIARIVDTGKEQLKKRRKAGLSSFYVRDGEIVEVFPNNSEHVRQPVKSTWVKLKKGKRSLKLE